MKEIQRCFCCEGADAFVVKELLLLLPLSSAAPRSDSNMSPMLLLVLFGLLTLIVCARRGRRRRVGEPPLINGWIPFLGKALEFRRDAHAFLQQQKRKVGDVFTVHIAGKYMTFIMDPLLYPNIIRHGHQLDFHKFSDKVAPMIFGYPPVRNRKSPGLHTEVLRSFKLLQGDNLAPLTDSMMGNLMLVFRQDHLSERPGEGRGWRSADMFDFCNSVMFEATFLTMYGRPTSTRRHADMSALREDFVRFDSMFPLLVAEVPIWLLRQTNAIRNKLINHFLPHRMSCWSNSSQFIRRRQELFEQYSVLNDVDKAAHHFAILWASTANTIPACFWAVYHLVSHPDALEIIRQEVLDVLQLSGVEFNRDKDITLSKDQLDKLLYLESAINESLRLSSASMNIRVAEEDFVLRLDDERSAAVRQGDIIVLYPQSVHMDPEIYEEPQSFRFDRYIEDGREKKEFYKDGQKLKYFRMPFGSGSTKCPGRYFAVNEIKQFVCLLLLYFDLRLQDGQRAAVDTGRAGLGILLPTADVRFRYRLRRA